MKYIENRPALCYTETNSALGRKNGGKDPNTGTNTGTANGKD